MTSRRSGRARLRVRNGVLVLLSLVLSGCYTQMALPGSGTWLLHVWTAPNFQIRPDVFMSGHPCLGPTDPLPSTDACWEIANHDPADGPYPGQDGGHDEHGH